MRCERAKSVPVHDDGFLFAKYGREFIKTKEKSLNSLLRTLCAYMAWHAHKPQAKTTKVGNCC